MLPAALPSRQPPGDRSGSASTTAWPQRWPVGGEPGQQVVQQLLLVGVDEDAQVVAVGDHPGDGRDVRRHHAGVDHALPLRDLLGDR